MKVLVLADIDRRIEEEFPELEFTFMGYACKDHIPSTHEEIRAVIPLFDILISEFDIIDKAVIDAAKNLKMIICCRGGVHSVVDVPYATKKGIVVKNTPARNASSVAEYVLGVIFNTDRKLALANELMLSDKLQHQKFILPGKYKDSLWGIDKYSPYHVFRGKGLHNFTLGVIGYGNVGRVVVNYAILLGIKVIVYNHHPIVGAVPSGVRFVDKETLLKEADYVSLHCNNRTRMIVMGEKEFFQMKKGAYFINTARGDLVDEDALISVLNNEHLSGATLDVTRKESLPPESDLIKAKNIFLTPHIAGATDEVIETGTDMTIYHLREFMSDMLRSEWR